MYNIKINEMLLRDGLQSLPKIYTIEKKLELYNLIKETNISFIEFGSTTAKNILPQMSNSYELYELIKHDKEDKNLIILCTSINGVKKSVNININNYSLVCSLSDDFGKHNLHCSSDLSFSKILEQLEYLIKNRFNLVRIYISCSFGCIVDKFNKEYINKLITWLNKLMLIVNIHFLKPDNFDIVLCDTFSIVDNTSLDEILLTIKNNCNSSIFEYIALHLHVDKTNKFTNLIINIQSHSLKKRLHSGVANPFTGVRTQNLRCNNGSLYCSGLPLDRLRQHIDHLLNLRFLHHIGRCQHQVVAGTAHQHAML
jgi:isopropylmalate/homocitrate/citramalate synthase